MFQFLKKLFGRSAEVVPTPPPVVVPPPELPPLPMNPTFESAIAANPGDATAWQVYADWLIEQGEPWGEVIASAHQGKPDSKREEAAQAALLGGFAASMTWHRGIILHFDFRPVEETQEPMHVVLERVLKHPAGHFIRSLTLGLPPSDALKWHMEDLTKTIANAGPLPCLQELDMSLPAEHMDQPSWRRVGDIRGLWQAVPNLKVLKLQGSAGSDEGVSCLLAPIDAPRLERFVFVSGGLDQAVPLELGAATLPSLFELDLMFGEEGYGCSSTVASLEGILSGKGLPALKTLGLKNSPWEAELIEAVAKSALLPRLQVVDFSMGVMGSEAVTTFRSYVDRFKHLKRLNLEDNYFSVEEQATLKALLPMAVFGEQKTEVDDPGYRYPSVTE